MVVQGPEGVLERPVAWGCWKFSAVYQIWNWRSVAGSARNVDVQMEQSCCVLFALLHDSKHNAI